MATTSRLAVLKRIERMYGLVEEMHSIALRQASARVQEAEAAIAEQAGRVREARFEGYRALGSGDREGWMLAEIERALAAGATGRLDRIRAEREAACQLVEEAYRASHLRRERMKSVVEGGVRVEQRLEARREQATMDDRFLSRMHWNRLQIEAV